MKVAKERLYLTADGTRVVREGDPDAASLFVAKGRDVSDADIEKYQLAKLVEGGPVAYDAIADHDAKHGGETEQDAALKRQAMLDGQPDPDGPPADGERGNLDEKQVTSPKATKAVTKAPANK